MCCAQLAPALRTIRGILDIIRRRPIQRAALSGRSGGDGRGGKTRNTIADNDRIELYYALPSANVDSRLFVIFATWWSTDNRPGASYVDSAHESCQRVVGSHPRIRGELRMLGL